MTESRKTNSLFDDIFRLQNTAPEVDVDPEDLVDGFSASLAEGVDTVETFGSSSLRRQAAIIPDDPKYQGQKTSRKDLYDDDDDDDEGHFTDSSKEQQSDESGSGDDEDKEDEGSDNEEQSGDSDNQIDGGNDEDNIDDGLGVDKDEDAEEIKDGPEVLPSAAKSDDDRAKGKAVMYQLGVWDDLIKSRIALQKMVTCCNKLPQPDTWSDFNQHESFRKETKNVHSSVRKLVSTLLELQSQLLPTQSQSGKSKSAAGDSDEEITSESEDDQEQGSAKNSQLNGKHEDKDLGDVGAKEDDSLEEDDDEMETEAVTESKHHGRQKRKLGVEEVEETIRKRHKDFQSFRNDTLSKWDEKTRLTRGKIKAKNFAAFEVSVLKQIEQVLVNRERLVKRLHQQRSAYRILGQPSNEADNKAVEDNVADDDDDDDVEIKLKQRSRLETEINHEIIDDNDFYHVCLRDLIEMKQNEETDPVVANKQWLEIQRLRNKQKKKVDTRASKGRKIRYHVKEKLKNFMTPYDKSHWSDEQKDDLFKALFGGRWHQKGSSESMEKPTINLGI